MALKHALGVQRVDTDGAATGEWKSIEDGMVLGRNFFPDSPFPNTLSRKYLIFRISKATSTDGWETVGKVTLSICREGFSIHRLLDGPGFVCLCCTL